MATLPKVWRALPAVAALIVLTGCATIVQGTSQAVGISSSPPGARVLVNGVEQGVTPTVLKLKRRENHVVVVELEGYHPYTATLTRSVSGWVAGNLVFGGLIGLVIDAASGGIYKLSPEQIAAALNRNVTVEQGSDMIFIGVVMEADSSWTKIGELEPVNATR
ncbi:MAG TPA: PEGA domain-containing protein [Longimicrobiales bacterium]|nr:PEGA domain-containing protein [Longimicrobiales bacterium]